MAQDRGGVSETVTVAEISEEEQKFIKRQEERSFR